jgi:hypothetical protein
LWWVLRWHGISCRLRSAFMTGLKKASRHV